MVPLMATKRQRLHTARATVYSLVERLQHMRRTSTGDICNQKKRADTVFLRDTCQTCFK